MKLISLNTWGCRVAEPIFGFIKQNSDADVFCLQEVMKGGNGVTERNERKGSFQEIQDILPTHSGYFAAYLKDSHYGESPKDFSFGIATFVRSDIGHSFYKSVELLDLSRTWSDYSGRSAAGVALAVEVEGFAVINIHGTWQDLVVEDTEAKIEESHKLIGLADEMPGRKILCGDFNLAPETRAIKVLDGAFVNLIDKNRITDTRGPLYTRSLRFADYIFTGQDVHARTLTVPGVSISDHLPLILEVD